MKGEFVLRNVYENAVLLVTSVGYETKVMNVKGSLLSIVLNKSVSQLNEVVINKGYYTEKQRFTTGNIATVKAKDIEKQPINNPLLALQGRVPGLFITQTSGIPGSGVSVLIQGRNSIRNGTAPLYVVDGVPYPSELPPGIGLGPLGNSGGLANGELVGTGNALELHQSIWTLKALIY